MKTLSLQSIHAVADQRKPGYVEAVLQASKPKGELYVVLEDHDYDRIRAEYTLSEAPPQRPEPPKPPESGPGTELKRLLGRVGITASSNCSCTERAGIMDEKGSEWVRGNLDLVVGWLREEAQKRGLPFSDTIGRQIVKYAIRRAEKQASQKQRTGT